LRRAGDDDTMKPEKRLFTYSVFYLFALFTALVVDRMMLA
jgi:protoheme IX farnesyltransferase